MGKRRATRARAAQGSSEGSAGQAAEGSAGRTGPVNKEARWGRRARGRQKQGARAGSPSAHHHDRRPQNHEDHGVRTHGHRAGPGWAGAPPPGPGAPPGPGPMLSPRPLRRGQRSRAGPPRIPGAGAGTGSRDVGAAVGSLACRPLLADLRSALRCSLRPAPCGPRGSPFPPPSSLLQASPSLLFFFPISSLLLLPPPPGRDFAAPRQHPGARFSTPIPVTQAETPPLWPWLHILPHLISLGSGLPAQFRAGLGLGLDRVVVSALLLRVRPLLLVLLAPKRGQEVSAPASSSKKVPSEEGPGKSEEPGTMTT